MQHRFWTQEEITVLEKYYPHVGKEITVDELAEVLNRTAPSVMKKCTSLNIKSGFRVDQIDYEKMKNLDSKCLSQK